MCFAPCVLGLSQSEKWVRCHPACHTDPDLEQSASLGSDRVFTSKIQLSTPSDICHVFVWRRRHLCMLASVTWCLVHSWNRGIIVNPHPPLRMLRSSQVAWHNFSTNDDHNWWTALQTLHNTSYAICSGFVIYLCLQNSFLDSCEVFTYVLQIWLIVPMAIVILFMQVDIWFLWQVNRSLSVPSEITKSLSFSDITLHFLPVTTSTWHLIDPYQYTISPHTKPVRNYF